MSGRPAGWSRGRTGFSTSAARRLLLGAWLLGVATPLLAVEPTSVRGVRGRATTSAVVNFRELERREMESTLWPPSPVEVPEPGPGPGPRPLPEGLRLDTPAAPPPDAGLLPGSSSASPLPASSFAALPDDGTAIPPDSHGAAGPTHLVVATNRGIRIQDRDGVTLSTVTLATFWAATGTVKPFDPKVLYDPYGGRFLVSAVSDGIAAASSILVGVSQSSDPTGNWNLYRVDADAADRLWADYPSIGFNGKWFVVQVNLFAIAPPGAFDHGEVYAFDKADLYAAGSGNFTRLIDPVASNGFVMVPAITLDPLLDTVYLLQQWNGNTGGMGVLRTSSITGPVGAEVLNVALGFPAAASPWGFDSGSQPDNFAPQLGTSSRIQTNDARIQNLVYRNGRLWAAQSVYLPAGGSPTRVSVQWWQLTPPQTVLQFGRIDDPTASQHFAFPSIAVNADDDALLGYSRFSAAEFASAAYSFRASADPPGTFQTEAPLKAGEATYLKDFGSGENRWGDYSATMVDPVNDLDFWTIQEYATSPANTWGTWWGRVGLSSCISLSITEPAEQTVCTGAPASLSTVASGTAPLTFRWRKGALDLVDGAPFSGTDTDTLAINPVSPAESAFYQVRVTDACSRSRVSAPAALLLFQAPRVTAPARQQVCPGGAAAFTVSATGNGPFTYQWRHNGSDVADSGPFRGSTTDTLTVAPVGSGELGNYDCLVRDACGTPTASTTAALVFEPPPTVTDPAGGHVCAGSAVAFAVTATAVPPVGYQWRLDGFDLVDGGAITGARGPTLRIDPVALGSVGSYDVVVVDGCGGTVTANAAVLQVTGAAPASPGNTLRAVRLGADVYLEWPAVTDATSYQINRCDAAAGPCVPAFYATPGAPNMVDVAVPAGRFWYNVEAVNVCGSTP